jgi:hypothetical protein
MIEMMIKAEDQIPDNFDLIFSDSGKQKHLINEKRHRHTKIFSTHSDLISRNYVDASRLDLMATKWFSENKKVGLIFH